MHRLLRSRTLDENRRLGRLFITQATMPSLMSEPGLPGEFPFTRGIQPTMYRGRLWTMRQYAGFGSAAESNARYRYLLVPGRQRAERRLRPADADGLRLGPSACAGRGRAGRRRHRLHRGHGTALRRHPAGSRVDVDDNQLDGGHPARALHCRGAPPERAGREADRHHSERHPEGVRRPGHLHLPAASVAANRHRHLRLLRTRTAELEHHLHQRVSHSRGRLDSRPGSRLHVGARDRLRAGRDRRRARREHVRSARVVLLQRAQRLPGGDRQVQGGPPPLGAPDARPLRRHQPARAAAPLPHANRRQHAHGPAAGQQHRTRRRAGDGSRARRNPVAALQRQGRGAGAADRGLRTACATDAAGDRR